MAYSFPDHLKYADTHEYIKEENGLIKIGVSEFAIDQLGDIVFVELPEIGSTVSKGEAFGVVESIKSVSDLYAPLSGEVIESNSELEGQPDLLNEAPYNNWLIKVRLTKNEELSELLPSSEYQKLQTEQ